MASLERSSGHSSPARLVVVVTVSALSSALAAAQTPPVYDFVTHGIQTARVEPRSGMPVLLINNQPVPPLLFFHNSEYDYDNRAQYMHAQVGMAADAGIHVVSMPFRPWPWEGSSPDYSWPDLIMDRYLAVNPKAVFLLRSSVSPGLGWEPETPPTADDEILYSDGSRGPVSAASDSYHQAFLRSFRALVNHYETSSYAPHILGYLIGGQTTDEWFPEGYREKGLDYSPVNVKAFRAWLAIRYRTDAALSAAWGRTATLAQASIQVPEPGRFPMHSTPPTAVMQSFYHLPQEQDWIDYSQYISDLISGRILEIARTLKDMTQGKKLAAFFHGYIYALNGSMTGHLRLDRLLRSPDVDIVASPISYLPIEGRLAALDEPDLHG